MASATSANHDASAPAQPPLDPPPPWAAVEPRAAGLAAKPRRILGVLALALMALLGTMGCSLTSFIRLFPPLTPSPTPIVFLTPVLQPTFTPTVLPPTDTPFPPTPTITPTATDTATPGPTPTATSTGESTATATPGPMILVPVAELNVRKGPGIEYPLAGTIRQGETYDIVGRTADYAWWRICCLPDASLAWVTASLVQVSGDATDVQIVTEEPPPTPTFTPAPPTPTPTITPTATEAVTFDVEGIEEFPNWGNNWLKVGAQIKASNGAPLWGYRLMFVLEGKAQSWVSPLVSDSSWGYSAPNQLTPLPDARLVNLQFDTNGFAVLGDNVWQVYVVDGSGTRRESSIVRLYTSASQPKWYHIRFKRRF